MRIFKRKNNRWIGTGTGLVSGTLMTYLRRKAKERNLSFELTSEQLWELFQKQNGKCALSGVELVLTTTINKQNNLDRSQLTASLDRINNLQGYTIDNVQWIHKTLNLMRREYTVNEFVHWCKLVASHANSEPSSVNDNKVTEKVQRLEGEESTNNPSTSAEPRYEFTFTGPRAISRLMSGEDIV